MGSGQRRKFQEPAVRRHESAWLYVTCYGNALTSDILFEKRKPAKVFGEAPSSQSQKRTVNGYLRLKMPAIDKSNKACKILILFSQGLDWPRTVWIQAHKEVVNWLEFSTGGHQL